MQQAAQRTLWTSLLSPRATPEQVIPIRLRNHRNTARSEDTQWQIQGKLPPDDVLSDVRRVDERTGSSRPVCVCEKICCKAHPGKTYRAPKPAHQEAHAGGIQDRDHSTPQSDPARETGYRTTTSDKTSVTVDVNAYHQLASRADHCSPVRLHRGMVCYPAQLGLLVAPRDGAGCDTVSRSENDGVVTQPVVGLCVSRARGWAGADMAGLDGTEVSRVFVSCDVSSWICGIRVPCEADFWVLRTRNGRLA